jgi:hypothetical protein
MTEQKVRRGRGPGKQPRQGITSVRIPVYVLDYYRQNFENSTAKMREVLVNYAVDKGANDGKEKETETGTEP